MGAVRFGVGDAVNVRFAISPLWETVAGYHAALDPGRHTVHLSWIRKALALLRDPGLAARTEPLRAVTLTPAPRCPLAELDEELAIFQAAPEVADAIDAWWHAAVKPYWPRMRAVLESDIGYRTRQLAEDGIQEVFAHLRPSLQWRNNQLVSPELSPDVLELDGTGITLAPTAFATRCRLLPGHGSTPPALLYPTRAAGTLWEGRDSAADGLARLLGRSRAQLLAYASSPATTTQLAARTGLSLGAVSQHLSVLREAGLVTSHRYRREVNYTASELGMSLMERG